MQPSTNSDASLQTFLLLASIPTQSQAPLNTLTFILSSSSPYSNDDDDDDDDERCRAARQQRSKNHTHSSIGIGSNDEDAASTAAEKQGEDDYLQAKIVAAWNNPNDEGDPLNHHHPDAAFAATITILSTQVDKLIQEGIAAFHQSESHQSELAHVQQEMARKDAEIASLRAAEEKNTVALSVRTVRLATGDCSCCGRTSNFIYGCVWSAQEEFRDGSLSLSLTRRIIF